MALGDGVEGAVAQAYGAGVVHVRLVSAFAQQPVEVLRISGRGGDVSAQGLRDGTEGAARAALLVVRRGMCEQLRRKAVVARRNADRQLAVGALVELRRPSSARAGAA
jgi:hypothetical protein